jgi:chromosome partitioning protein
MPKGYGRGLLSSKTEAPDRAPDPGGETIGDAQTATATRNWELLEVRPIVPGTPRIVSFTNQKGGVGKTTTSVNLAAALALRGHRVLVVDVDPQSNATTGLGIDHRTLDGSTYDVIVNGSAPRDIVRPTGIEGLDCLPSSPDLAGAEIELVKVVMRERRLAEALEGSVSGYDLVFLDCPPSLGLLTVNALAAAQDLIVPVQCEYYALEGLGQLMGTAERVQGGLNDDLRIGGFVLTMYDARTRLSSQVAEEVRSHFGEAVFETVVPRSVRLSEAPSFGEPVLTLDPSSRGALSYRLLASEFESRFGLTIHVPVPPPSKPNRSDEEQVVRTATPGPGGRGYGVTAPPPRDLEAAWPKREPWSER